MAKKKTRKPYRRRTDEELIADLEREIAAIKQRKRNRNPFSAVAVAAERERLELSAAAYGELVGVSALTIYSWEQGRTSPRDAQLEKWLAVQGIEKEDAWERLELEPAFTPEAVFAERERLELSAADYGKLVGISMQTVYNWEKGRSKPRAAQLERWLELQGIGKREAWRKLEEMET